MSIRKIRCHFDSGIPKINPIFYENNMQLMLGLSFEIFFSPFILMGKIIGFFKLKQHKLIENNGIYLSSYHKM